VDYPSADLNLDCRVDLLELAELFREWGQTEDLIADLNDDGVVDIEDLLELAEGWLACGRMPVETCEQ
jgi:hypothetical protein